MTDVIDVWLILSKDMSVGRHIQIFTILRFAFARCQPNPVYNDDAVWPIEVDNHGNKVSVVVLVDAKAKTRSFFPSLGSSVLANLFYVPGKHLRDSCLLHLLQPPGFFLHSNP